MTLVTKEKTFKDDLKNLFDVASSNALNLIINKEDRNFFFLKGLMRAVDIVLAFQEELTEHRRMLKERRRQCAKEEDFKSYATVKVESSTSCRGCEESSKDNTDAL